MISLQPYNTFRLNHFCEQLHFIHNENDLRNLLPFSNPPLIIGGGSNILLTKDCRQPVLINEIKGKEIVETSEDHVIVKLGSGENWHDAVLWALENDLGGIENLSLIPGKCGAAPIQNIGAYGVELKDVFVRLDAINLSNGEKHYFNESECKFGYRESVFKKDAKNKFFIQNIYLKLDLPGFHRTNLSYGRVNEQLEKENLQPTIQNISKVIVDIRQSKLPDPDVIPNCGSFFKNPIISKEIFQALQIDFETIPSYPYVQDTVKVPAGWLIEQCGWKGKKINGVGCHENHALVICNYTAQFGWQIQRYYQKIQESVLKKFGINLIPEVNIW